MGAVAPALAVDPTFTFTGGNSAETGAVGNVRSFTSTPGALGVSVSAFSAASGTGPLQKAYLGDYSKGLGVTNNITATTVNGVTTYTTTDNSHTVDNQGNIDYVVFKFSTPLQAMTVSLAAFGDTDIQVWTGNLPSGYDFTGMNLATIPGVTNQGVFLSGSTAAVDRTVSFTNFGLANFLIVGANPYDAQGNDDFKIGSLTVKAVPGPIAGASLPALLAIGGVMWARRRKTA